MNRRGMLGFLGLGAVAGPSVAREVFQTASPPLSSQYGYDPINKSVDIVDNSQNYVKRMQDELGSLTIDPAAWIADRLANDMRDYMMGYSGISFNSIDPDIRNMKSITESAKMRIHFERRARRQLEMQKESLTHRIAEYMGLKE